jgi:hypothetical protein
MTVRVGRECASGATCFPLWPGHAPAAVQAVERRARFLAWPIASAMVLRTRSDDDAHAATEALRALAARSSRVALILRSSELHGLRLGPELLELEAAARRLQAMVSRNDETLLARLVRQLLAPEGAGGAGADDPLPWLELPSRSILVVPKLGGLATLDGFVAEVEDAVARVVRDADYLVVPWTSGLGGAQSRDP